MRLKNIYAYIIRGDKVYYRQNKNKKKLSTKKKKKRKMEIRLRHEAQQTEFYKEKLAKN